MLSEGEVRIDVASLGYRGSFVGAVLATLPGAITLRDPARVRLERSSGLRAVFGEILDELPRARPERYSRDEHLARLVVTDARNAVAAVVADSVSFLTEGSAGKGNWAETPWVAVFDRLVTETAQRGYYLVYLFRPDGAGVYLSLNQGTTAVRNHFGARYREVLAERATTYATYLDHHDLSGLRRGPIDIGGQRGLTHGYESGNVAARYYPAGALPDEDTLIADLHE